MERIDYTMSEATSRHRAVERHATIGALPFSGRSAEIAGLLDAWHDTYNGSRILAVIAGEMGSGKSRLLDEFCQRPELQRSFVVRLRLYGDDCHKDLKVLRESLLDALEARPALRRHIESALDNIALARDQVLPLGRVLDLLARRVPLVLAIDNLDSGGEECWKELGAVLNEIDHSFLLLITSSPAAMGQMVGFSRSIEAEAVEIRLGPLNREAFARCVAELFGITASDEDLDWLIEATRGLPVLLREAINALLRTGCIVRRGEAWEQVHPFARSRFTPLDALPLLKWRLAQLAESDRRLLATVALLGNRVPRLVLAELGIALESCATLTAHDFLRISGRYVEFSHRLLFDAAFAEAQHLGLCGQLRDDLMVAIAPGADDRGVRLPRLTIRTLLEQVDTARRGELLQRLLNSAEELTGLGDYPTAATYFSECRRWWPEIAACHDEIEVARWMLHYADILYKLGRTDQQQELLHEVYGGIDFSSAPPELAQMGVHAMLGLIEAASRAKKINEAMKLIERASATIACLPASSETEKLSLRIKLRRGQVLEASERGMEAVPIYRDIIATWDATTFSPCVFEAMMWLQNLVRSDDEVAQLHRHIEQLLEVCEREERMRSAVQLRAILAMGLFTMGEYEQAEPAMRTLIAEARRYSLPRTESSAWSVLAKLAAMRGNYAEALPLLDRTIEIRWRVRSIAFWQLSVITKIQFLTAAERDDEALALLDELARDAALHNRPHRRFIVELCRSRIAVRRGDGATEVTRLDELRQIGQSEDFESLDQMLLELEGEILLRAPKVALAEARNYCQRVHHCAIEDMGGWMLRIMALGIIGRATASSSTAASRRGASQEIEYTVARGIETLQEWKRCGAMHNIAAALGLLRMHASHLIDSSELAPFEAAASASSEPSYRYDIRAFGRLRILDLSGVEQGGRHFGTQKSDSKPRKMLAALVVAAVDGQGLSRERLVDMIWGEGATSDSASNNFHVTLSGLRQVVGDTIDFDGGSYALDTSILRIDVLEFLALLERAMQADRQGRSFQAYDLLTRACELYSGEFLEGIYDEWSDRARDMLRAKGRSARLRLAEIALRRGEQDIVHATVQALLLADATDESAMYLRLSAFQAEGDRVHSLREYEKFAELLAAEYGVTPSRQLRELRDEIARQ
jgi:DNA-binding SARP family transcriptional activator/tetratricopeptide (TPR) repeat protein